MANLLSLFIFYLSIAIYIANCEQENSIVYRDFKFIEGNMDREMERETISHAAKLIDATKDKVIPSLGSEMAHHMEKNSLAIGL